MNGASFRETTCLVRRCRLPLIPCHLTNLRIEQLANCHLYRLLRGYTYTRGPSSRSSHVSRTFYLTQTSLTRHVSVPSRRTVINNSEYTLWFESIPPTKTALPPLPSHSSSASPDPGSASSAPPHHRHIYDPTSLIFEVSHSWSRSTTVSHPSNFHQITPQAHRSLLYHFRPAHRATAQVWADPRASVPRTSRMG